jgi:putative endonuclease
MISTYSVYGVPYDMPYYVYIIRCKGGSFYTGYTKDLNSRIMLHMNGKGARYTRIHRAQKLVYAEEFGSRAEAMRNEKRIKGLTHHEKLGMINSRTRAKMTSRHATKFHNNLQIKYQQDQRLG